MEGRGRAQGKPFFLRKQGFPLDPLPKKAAFTPARPAEGGAGGRGRMGGGDYQSRRNQARMYGGRGGKPFFLRKQGFPRAPFQRKPLLTPPAPRRAGRAARGRMGGGDYQSRRIRSTYGAAGKPFFLRKKGFPRATPFQRKPLLRRPPRGERGGRRGDGWSVGDYQSRRKSEEGMQRAPGNAFLSAKRKVSPGPLPKKARF